MDEQAGAPPAPGWPPGPATDCEDDDAPRGAPGVRTTADRGYVSVPAHLFDGAASRPAERDGARLPAPREPTDPALGGRDAQGGGPEEGDADGSGSALGPRLAQLESRLDRVERQLDGLLGSAIGVESDDDAGTLNLADPELCALAAAADRAQGLARMLATPAVLAACERAVEAHRDWLRGYAHARDEALAASRILATTSAGQRSHREAERRFVTARAQLATLLPDRQRVANAARHAAEQLERDREIRDRHGREIDEGQRAWLTLLARLRRRLTAMVERDEPLPRWLVDALGGPPADSQEWRELAVQLLAYRLTYSVTDPERPLGAEPSSADPARRRRWYRSLARELASAAQ